MREKMRIITLDFETFYDSDFSLSKLTTEAYIKDSRFQVIGVGIKVDDGLTHWYTGTHKYIKEVVDGQKMLLKFQKLEDYCRKKVYWMRIRYRLT